MKLSARNQLKGTVKALVPGAINCEVLIELAPGIEIAAQISSSSVERLGLKVGSPAYAVVKADSVMVAID